MNLDLKDKKILYQLDLNARQSNSELAKKVGLSKETVGYRIKQLEKNQIIRGYTTVIDSAKLGYTFYRIFLNLIDTNPEKMNELIEFLKQEKNVWWIATLDGAWNFAFAIWAESNEDFREFYNQKLYANFKPYIKDKLLCIITSYKQLNRSYLLGLKKETKTETVGGGKKTEYDDIDLKILRMLSNNARIQLLEIAKKLNLDSMTIYHRIKKLEQKGIIEGYKANINFNLIKREFYSIKINMKDISQMKQLEAYIKTIPEVTGIIEAIGSYDFEFDMEVENTKKYFKIIEDLRTKFNNIREILYFRIIKNYKILYMPEV